MDLTEREFGLTGQGSQIERRLPRPVAICDQPAQYVDHKVDRAAVARVLNLRDVLQLVNDCLYDYPPAE